MSDRTRVLTVLLDDDYRIDDIGPLLNAIGMLKGIIDVKPNVSNLETYTAYSKARIDLESLVFKALREALDKKAP